MKAKILCFIASISVLASCSLLGSGGKNSHADLPGTIVFAAKDSAGTSQIYTIKANGANLKQLTHEGQKGGPAGASQPSWSPDGRQIIYSSFTMSNSVSHPALMIMNADGSNDHVLFQGTSYHPLWGRNARWSPDGTKVAYDLCLNCQLRPNSDIYVFDTITNTKRQLTQSPASDLDPVWSPDGTRIAFTSKRDYVNADTLRFRHDLYVMNMDGTGLQRLTRTGYAQEALWGPNNTSVTFRSTSSLPGTYKVNIQSGNIAKIEGDPRESKQLHPVAWSPDNNQLLIITYELGRQMTNSLYIYKKVIDKMEEIYSKASRNSNPALYGADWFVKQ